MTSESRFEHCALMGRIGDAILDCLLYEDRERRALRAATPVVDALARTIQAFRFHKRHWVRRIYRVCDSDLVFIVLIITDCL